MMNELRAPYILEIICGYEMFLYIFTCNKFYSAEYTIFPSQIV